MSSRITLRSPAKINLLLKVLRKRDDGYHDIVSIMQAVSLFDEVVVSVLDDGRSNTRAVASGPDVPGGSGNIAFRAAEAFRERTGGDFSVSIEIEKKIPVGAGLGGGSSNAAAVLRGLERLLGAGLAEGDMMEMAAGLGSDVPFFLLGAPALATSRGEVLERIALPSYDYVLVNPGFQVSTAWVYGNLGLTKPEEDNNVIHSDVAFGDVRTASKNLANDLERVVTGAHSEIAALKRELLDAGALGALMSGSGPTVFGIFAEGETACKACERLRERLAPGLPIFQAAGL